MKWPGGRICLGTCFLSGDVPGDARVLQQEKVYISYSFGIDASPRWPAWKLRGPASVPGFVERRRGLLVGLCLPGADDSAPRATPARPPTPGSCSTPRPPTRIPSANMSSTSQRRAAVVPNPLTKCPAQFLLSVRFALLRHLFALACVAV